MKSDCIMLMDHQLYFRDFYLTQKPIVKRILSIIDKDFI